MKVRVSLQYILILLMQEQSNNFSRKLGQPPIYVNRPLQHTHIVYTPKLIRFIYYQQQREEPLEYKQYCNPSRMTVQNTESKKDVMRQSKSNKLLVVSRAIGAHNEKLSASRTSRKFIELSLKSNSHKPTKIKTQTSQQAQPTNHIQVLPIFPLITCGQCQNCEQIQSINSEQRVSLSSKRSIVKDSLGLFASKIEIRKVNHNNITFSGRKKIFDDYPALNHSLQSFSKSRSRKIFEPLNFGNRSVSFERSTSMKKKIFGQYSAKISKRCAIKSQEETVVSDIPSVILSQWQIQEQRQQEEYSNRIQEKDVEESPQIKKDED